jgi:hypothetical protein
MDNYRALDILNDAREGRCQRHTMLRLVPHTLTLVLSLLVGIGCSGSKVTTQVSSDLPRYQIRTIVLVPFTTLSTPQVRDATDQFMSAPQGAKRSDISLDIPSAVEPQSRQTTAVPEHAAEKITQLFWARLKNRQGIEILSSHESAKAVVRQTAESGKAAPESEAASLATKLKADAALIGQVLVYQERSGSKLGANPPATVGFEVKVIAADGKVLWVGNYYERQKPMIEDFLGFIQHGGGFVTAEELAQYGVNKVVKTFPFGTAGE